MPYSNRYIILSFSFLILILSCNKEEPVPAWVIIPEYQVMTTPDQGTALQKITEVYAYTTSSFLGVFPIPGKIPILEFGETQLDLFPGIRANGIKSTPDIYAFFSRSRQTLDLQPGKFDTIVPVYTYDPLVKIRMVENFESSIKWFTTQTAGYPLEITTDNEIEGKAGTFLVDETEPIFEVATPAFTDIPLNNTPIYLEMHYKTEIPFLIGLEGSSPLVPNAKQYIAGVNAKDEWNKIYFSLTDAFNLSDLESYKVIIRADLPINGSVDSGRVWIDNIKLIHQ
ncbi:MAG: hypothetical protein K9I85_04725 [Saprospiraceae bacterium]|nr:hypothetical protein [Saprospiraceae bacterium]